MFRSDGFKKVVKGLSYKRNSTSNLIRSGSGGVYSSMGRRVPIAKQSEGEVTEEKVHYLDEKDYGSAVGTAVGTAGGTAGLRRNKTADLINGGGRHPITYNR